jgi:hypothetical protein
LQLGDVDDVPYSFVQQAREKWWKYLIPQFFPAYTPNEIEEWPADVILEHLAAISEIRKAVKTDG